MIRKILLILTCCTLSWGTYAEEPAQESKQESKFSYPMQFLILEAIIGFNAWSASKHPNGYGTLAALVFPLAAVGSEEGPITAWSTFFGAESIALYNLNVDEDDYSKREVFENNMIAWHLFAGILTATSYMDNKWFNKETVSFVPTQSGGHITFNYKF